MQRVVIATQSINQGLLRGCLSPHNPVWFSVLGDSFACGAVAMTLENLFTLAFDPTKKDEISVISA
jgi:hypothetical protein